MPERKDEDEPSLTKRAGLLDLLSFYYPMHYRIGMDLEGLMGQGRVSRKQAAILWLVHSRADEDGWVRRKAIEEKLSTWFEISNSSISLLLRDLTSAPLKLVFQTSNPDSAREKLVRLTAAGERFVAGMIDEAVAYLDTHLAHISSDQLDLYLNFFKLAFRPLVPDDRAQISQQPPVPDTKP